MFRNQKTFTFAVVSLSAVASLATACGASADDDLPSADSDAAALEAGADLADRAAEGRAETLRNGTGGPVTGPVGPITGPISGPIVRDPWSACANYAQLQQALKGDATFAATGYNIGCHWHDSDVQEHLTITNTKNFQFPIGSQIFWCAKGGATGKLGLSNTSLQAGGTTSVFVPWGSGPSCLAKAVVYTLKNPPK